MKSNICKITKNKEDLSAVFNEVAMCASYNNLEDKPARQLRLLSEELINMLPELVSFSEGEFWIENIGPKYEIHAVINVESADLEYRERVLSVSRSGKNDAARGIMGKIRSAIEAMVETYSDPEVQMDLQVYDMGSYSSRYYTQAWSLSNYKNQIEDIYRDQPDLEEWDELEKSIVANLADDVIVGIKGGKVYIIIKKRVWA